MRTTIHIAPRETCVKNVLDILGLGDNKCKPMPTPTVQTRQKSDEDEPRLGEEDRRAYHRCVGTLRHLLKCRPDIAFAVHESPGDADLRRLRRLGRCDADWSGESINRKSASGGILKLGSATLRKFTKGQSCQTLSSEESEHYAAVTTTAHDFWPLKQLAASSSDRGADLSSTLKRDSCGFKRNMRKER